MQHPKSWSRELMGGFRGGGGDRGSGPPPWKITKNLGFLSNTGPDALKSQSYQASIHCWACLSAHNETPFKWRFAGGPMMARL